ncbi:MULTISPECIES: HAD-IIB family hydrolase [Rhizobium/Agrobacterium group]|uniref:HAD-IIB family hydrolase n=1 Tax=Neorhizobium petrolearium TaxID=515361 RepID=A0ABY8LV68_9HYPH|nr:MULTISPECIES: HAD-IIB family hydrolase [Rhizobium/Agrobacterium group]MCC2611005.1 HAD-IIB family hydrolase [Neorhizobium petrolearium]WGI66225.1 HAD-IIB family hydrolase [Neorhizobium petrolearium]
MYFLALAVDFDGTIAEHGYVTPATVSALERLRQTGRKLLLVTGRELNDLQHAFTQLEIFDVVIAENGALLFEPGTQEETRLAPPPPIELVQMLADRKVTPISVGRSIIATWRPHETAVMNAIEELGLEMQIIFNKGAVMVLPANVNKASGLRHALATLGISPLNTVGAGDAENDHAFLACCGCSAAVANAVPSLKKEADLVLSKDHGDGIAELVEKLIRDDRLLLPLTKRAILAGVSLEGEEIYIEPSDIILIIGNSGCGKSSYITLLTERMAERGFEFCVVDPEGDYLGLDHAVTIGGLADPPATEEALRLLLQANIDVVVNTLALNHDDRRHMFMDLVPAVKKLQRSSGRPHWFVVDEAHQFLPPHDPGNRAAPRLAAGAILVTVDPARLAPAALAEASTVIAMGSSAGRLLQDLADILKIPGPAHAPQTQGTDFLLWSPRTNRPPLVLKQEKPQQAHHRHRGKYATGDVGEWRSFYFRGPQLDINYQASNLAEFLHQSDEVDDEIWLHHLRSGDYSAWFRHVIRDDILAADAAQIERNESLSPLESRKRIRQPVTARYVIPAVYNGSASLPTAS